MLAAGAGRVCCFFVVFFVVFLLLLLLFFFVLFFLLFFFISSVLSSFSNASSFRRRLDILKYCSLGRSNPTVVVSYSVLEACSLSTC